MIWRGLFCGERVGTYGGNEVCRKTIGARRDSDEVLPRLPDLLERNAELGR